MKESRTLRLPLVPGLKVAHVHFSLVREHARWRPNVSQNSFEYLKVCPDLGSGYIYGESVGMGSAKLISEIIISLKLSRDMI